MTAPVPLQIVLLGNHQVTYSSESHHAASLELLGHTVIRLQEPSTSAATITTEVLRSDLFVWIHTHGWETPGIEQALATIRAAGIPIIAYHLDLYMPIGRWRQYENSPYLQALDHWFTVDPQMANWLNNNTPVRGHFLPAGVFGPECYIATEPSEHANDVVFVGSKGYHREWPWRPRLIQWLKDTYGSRFTHVGGDGDTGTLRGDDLNRMYANSKVAVGDTLCIGYDYPYYVSDRAFECPGRFGFSLFPRIRGIEDWFTDGEEIVLYKFGDLDGLKCQIDYYVEHDAEREAIRLAGHERVKAEHTYKHRWEQILATVFG